MTTYRYVCVLRDAQNRTFLTRDGAFASPVAAELWAGLLAAGQTKTHTYEMRRGEVCVTRRLRSDSSIFTACTIEAV